MKVVNVDSIDYHLVNGGYYADKDDIDELDTIEMYTKDEVIAMFTELQKEFEGLCKKDNSNLRCYDYNNGISTCYRATQSKIDKLKKEKEEENNE